MSKTVVKATVVEQVELSSAVKLLTLYMPEIAAQAKPGQFVHIRVADSIDPLLRRPISIAHADADKGTVTLIYRIVGHGTTKLARIASDETLDCMGPLGSGFDLDCRRPLLVGGGMGLAPLLFLARHMCPAPVEIVMGGRNKKELFWADLFRQSCHNLHVTTDDGSMGTKGLVVDVLPRLIAEGGFDRIYACGPKPMLQAIVRLAREAKIPCQVSLEEYMACGVGACLSCTCAGTDGVRRKVCTDGPVFWAEEVME